MKPVIEKTHLSLPPRIGSARVSLAAILVLTLVFFLDQRDFLGISELFPASGSQVLGRGEFWRLWTSVLTHADLQHLLNNIWAFAGLSYLLFGYFGFQVFPVLSLLTAGVINAVTLWTYPPQVTLVGASGVVYFMAAFWLALYVGIERRISLPRRLANGLAFALILLAPSTFEPRVSYRAHAVGFIMGLFLGMIYFWVSRRKLQESEVLREASPSEEPWIEEQFGPLTDQRFSSSTNP